MNAPIALTATTPTVASAEFVNLAQQSTTTGAHAQAASNGIGGNATVTWGAHMDSDMVKRCNYVISSTVIPAPGQTTQASTTIPYHEVLVELTAAAPRPVNLTYSFGSAASAGTILFEVDMGDTGVFSLSANSLTLSTTLSAQPYRIRIRAQSQTPSVSTQAVSTSAGHFYLDVTPDNDLTLTKAVAGCGTEAVVGPVFTSSGIGLRAPNTFPAYNAPMVAVFGTRRATDRLAQPVDVAVPLLALPAT